MTTNTNKTDVSAMEQQQTYTFQDQADPGQTQQPTAASPGQVGEQEPLHLNSKAVYRIAITICIIGASILICEILAVSLFAPDKTNQTYSGIWAGTFIVLCGGMGITSSIKSQNRLLNGLNLICNIIAFILCVVAIAFFVDYIKYYQNCAQYYVKCTPWCHDVSNPGCPDPRGGAMAMYGIMTFLTVTQMMFSVTVAVLCHKAFLGNYSNMFLESCVCPEEQAYDNFHNEQQSSQVYQYQSQTANLPNQSFQSGHASNIQNLPPGQILYMLTPVAVTTQKPHNVPNQPNVFLPQGNVVLPE